jgi:accessory colonization factor AcfC
MISTGVNIPKPTYSGGDFGMSQLYAVLFVKSVVIVKTNPIQDIRSLENNENIVFVMKDGKGVKEQ